MKATEQEWSNRLNATRAAALVLVFWGLSCVALALMPPTVQAQLASLKTVPVPEPPNLANFVRDKAAAIQLGKALFWDMQVGSDGVQSCATCHFHAGADSRVKNQINPGRAGRDTKFTIPPNTTLKAANFPFHQLADPDFRESAVLFDTNDVVSSQGVVHTQFNDIVPGSAVDDGTLIPGDLWKIKVNGVNTNIRRVEPRNTPSVINAAFNFYNFWDGRANNIFNGVNPFGAEDENAKVFITQAGHITPTAIRIRNASLASQAVGPPVSGFEMSFEGRTWPKVGKKMLSLQPLAQQIVHPADSVLGPLANSTATVRAKGLNTTYAALIKLAFQPKFWNKNSEIVTFDALTGAPTISPKPAGALTTDQFTQMEANFSLFFGLAVQLYEATLIADDSPFDRFLEGSGALTQQEQQGLNTFTGAGSCVVCHAGPELTNASVANLLAPVVPGALPNPRRNPPNTIEFMNMVSGSAFYDIGSYNIGVRPTGEDPGRAGLTPFDNPLVPGTKYPLSFSELAMLKFDALLPPAVDTFVPPLPLGFLPTDTFPTDRRTDVHGAFKVPHLRNVELTGPYFRTGGALNLDQVVDFYTRGGDFPNLKDIAPAISIIGRLRGKPARKAELVAFLLALTDPRVKNEGAPFDHPELFVPNGAAADGTDLIERIPEVGTVGRVAEGLPPIGTFLNANPFGP